MPEDTQAVKTRIAVLTLHSMSESELRTIDRLDSEDHLLQVMTTPSQELVEFAAGLSGPLVVLGAGGKMGPSLSVLAKRALQESGSPNRVVAVSRFSDQAARDYLDACGVETISADLLNPASWEELPDSENVVYLVGQKFGTSSNPSLTWAINTVVPPLVCQRYSGARIAALSSGNVYPYVSVETAGSVEEDAVGPVGEYANACVGRERLFQFYADTQGAKVVLIRLNYAVEPRYGVLHDLVRDIHIGNPINLATGHFNCIWQGDANDRIIRSLGMASCPASILNVTGQDVLQTREVALSLASMLGRSVSFTGEPQVESLLNDASRSIQLFGSESVDLETLCRWSTNWCKDGLPTLAKPTHFLERSGKF